MTKEEEGIRLCKVLEGGRQLMKSGSENVQFQWTIQSSILENFQLSVSMDLRSVKHKSMPYLQSNACK